MAYDKILAARIRAALYNQPGLTEKEMFGGVGFMLQGNMACGVIGDELILRVKPEDTQQVLSQPHTRVFDMSGKPMRGWVVVMPEGVQTTADLKRWVKQGIEYAATLPGK